MMRIEPDSEDNRDFWLSRPPLRWRHPVQRVRPQATVLARALSETGTEEQRALIAVQNAGLGRVVYLAFDRTWRLRFRAGDKYHHRFWGQLLRWATGGRLPAGPP